MLRTDGLMLELRARLGQSPVELHHLPSEQGSKLAEYLFVPCIILERDFTLHASEVDHHGTVFAARVRCVKGRAGFPWEINIEIVSRL